MVLFFSVAALMVVAGVAVIVVPMVRSRSTPDDDREQQNIAIARERLEQLEARVAAGAVSPEQAEQEKTEIELALFDDVDSTGSSGPNVQAAGGWAGFAVAAAVPILAGLLYLTLGQPAALAPPSPETAGAESSPHDGADLATVVQRLEQRLSMAPNDVEGWRMLGNSYMMLKRYDRAAMVFQQIRELAGDDADLLVRQADALAMTRGGALDGEPEALVAQALKLNPDHPVGLWLAGLSARRRGDSAAAITYWQRAEPLFAGDPSLPELQRMIADAQGASPAPLDRAATKTSGAGATAQVRVSVSLDSSLTDRVDAGDTVFVFARALNGPPMPLAAVRKRVADLPLQVTLDDSMAMTPQLKLSGQEEVAIVARVSKSGDAKARKGDLIGEVAPVATVEGPSVNIVISRQVE